MDKNNPNIILLKPKQRTSENVKEIARAVYSVATGKYEAPAQCCERTYEDFLSENISIIGDSGHFDWYLFPCHCETTKCLNFDPLENIHDAIFFLWFCKFFQEGPKYSKEQIGDAPDTRMAICKKAIDQWFNPECHETYWIRLLKILQHLDYTLRSLMILETPEAYQYFVFILKEICLPYFKDDNNDRYQDLYRYDANFHQNIAFFNYLSMEYLSVKSSSNAKVYKEEEILTRAYQNIVGNIKDTKGNLKKNVFSLKRNSANGKYVLDILDSRKKSPEKAKDSEEKNKKSTDLKKLEEKENKGTKKDSVAMAGFNNNEEKDKKNTDLKKLEEEENKGTKENSTAIFRFKNDVERENNVETINFKASKINKDINNKNIKDDVEDSSTEDNSAEKQYIIKIIDNDGNKQQQTQSKYFLGWFKLLSCIIMIIAAIWPVLKVFAFPKLNIIFVVIPTPLLMIGGIFLLMLISYMQNKSCEKPEFVQQQSGQKALNNVLEHTKNYSKNKGQIQLENNLNKRQH